MLRINPQHLATTRFPAAQTGAERDTLPFPSGGVYGSNEPDRVGSDALARIDHIQRTIDGLSDDLEEDGHATLRSIGNVIGRIGSTRGSSPPPAAA